MFVVPKKGLRVKDPITMLPLPPEGKDVPDNVYWTRRRIAGDVEVQAVEPVKAPEVSRPVSTKTKGGERKA